MELRPWKLPSGMYAMEGTSGTYTMEVTKWNLRYGRYFMVLTPCKLPLGTYTMEVNLWNLHHGS